MATHQASQTITVAATPQACFDALTGYEQLPDWQRGLKRVAVVEQDAASAVVDYVLDAKVREVSYRLRLTYDAPHRLVTEYVSGDFRDLSAVWSFADNGDGTTEVELALELDAGRFIPSPVRGIVRDIVLGRAMSDLKGYFEP